MAPEEAIKYLRQIYPNGGHCWLDSQRIEAIDMAIAALSQPSLPSNLDEAANKYADGENPTCPCEECLIKTFKAGAEWMAGQGASKEGEVFDNDEFIKFSDGTFIDLDPSQALIPAFNLNNGDKVVVQIRKK